MTSDQIATRTVSGIPVRNLWLLLLYASQLYREIPANHRYGIEESPDDLPGLVAEILTRSVEQRLRRNLSHDFQRRNADLTRVRGRIDSLRTVRRSLLQRGRIACSFDELTTDTPRNQFVKAALSKLVQIVENKNLSRRCRTAAAALERAGVTNTFFIENRRRYLEVAAIGRANSEDRRMLAAAHLAFDLSLPTEEAGHWSIPAPERNKDWLRRLFEGAVGGFYGCVLSPQGWIVRTGRRLNWQIVHPTARIGAILPSMKTDIILESPRSPITNSRYRTIIDTKFTSILGAGRYRESSLHSEHIYQIYAYLRSQERFDDPPSANATGMLLYPSIHEEVDEEATIQGHRIRFTTVNLAADSRTIRNRLIAIADANLCPRS